MAFICYAGHLGAVANVVLHEASEEIRRIDMRLPPHSIHLLALRGRTRWGAS
jgi:hypothetical protein